MIFDLACYLICTGDALSNSSAWQEERGPKVLDAPRDLRAAASSE